MSLMKQHLGSAKPAYSASKQCVMSHLQTAHATTDSDHSTEVETLKRQIADISSPLNSMTAESQEQKLPKQKVKSLSSSAKPEVHPVKKKGKSAEPCCQNEQQTTPLVLLPVWGGWSHFLSL